MSFLKRLFGGGTNDNKPAAEITYKDCQIVAMPKNEGGQFRLNGIIAKQINGETRQHVLIRADMFTSADDCVSATFMKAKRVIDEQGDRLFSS